MTIYIILKQKFPFNHLTQILGSDVTNNNLLIN